MKLISILKLSLAFSAVGTMAAPTADAALVRRANSALVGLCHGGCNSCINELCHFFGITGQDFDVCRDFRDFCVGFCVDFGPIPGTENTAPGQVCNQLFGI